MERKKGRGTMVVLAVLPVVAFLFSLAVGRYPVSLDSLFSALWAQLSGAEMTTPQLALIRVRLLRTLVAMIVGASLSLSGAVYQGLFKNPIVSPDLLGASTGASFGAALAILIGSTAFQIQAMAFLGGLLAVGLVAVMNRMVSRRSHSVVNLVQTFLNNSTLYHVHDIISLSNIWRYISWAKMQAVLH